MRRTLCPSAVALVVATVAFSVAQGCGGGGGKMSSRAAAAIHSAQLAQQQPASTATSTGSGANTFTRSSGATVAGGATSGGTSIQVVGSRFWYEGDTYGNPLKILTGAEAAACAQVLDLMNVERAKVGLQPLAFDLDCERASKAHAEDMVGRQYFAHVSPEGWTPDQRLTMVGALPTTQVAENINAFSPTPADVVASWMASQGHRENILSPTLVNAAVGVAGGGQPLWVAVFSTR
jgi:uncharacterized protein YkwD